MSGSYVPPSLTVPVGPHDWSEGHENAPVTIVEYGDFECSHCAAMEPVLRELRRLAGNSLRVVFRHFPLTSSHPHAELAAEAAEAAGAQGAFWPMHDILLQNQQALTPNDLVGYAAGLGLDARQIAADLDNRSYKEAVQEDFMSGVRSGVSGTPTFYINGSRYDGAYELDALWRAVQKAARLAR